MMGVKRIRSKFLTSKVSVVSRITSKRSKTMSKRELNNESGVSFVQVKGVNNWLYFGNRIRTMICVSEASKKSVQCSE